MKDEANGAMTLAQVKALDHQYYMNTFGERAEVLFERGQGCALWDSEGKQYIDFLAGIATNALGYNHPGLTALLTEQIQKPIHLSNYFYNPTQALLAQALCAHSCAEKVFFASTGAEANEGAIKLVRKYFYAKNEHKYKIISCDHSFHGRTLATLAATGQEKYRAPFVPMPDGFVNVPYGDLQAMHDAVDGQTAAIFVEPIQGEGGIIEGGEAYLQGLRALCDEKGLLLVFDEVQCGMGRTGTLFAHQGYGVEPDIFTTAKALGNGLPISALMCKAHCAAFAPGDHGTTLGGNSLCTSVGLFIINTITQGDFLQQVQEKGDYLKKKLQELGSDKITQVRGKGLMLGVQLAGVQVADVVKTLRARGLIVGTAGNNVLRLVPPLIIGYEEIDVLLAVLKDVLAS